jgi:hypothetical protein
MEEMPSLSMPVQRFKVAILPLDLPCPGPVTNSGEILTTGKSHGKKPDRFSFNDDTVVKKVSRFLNMQPATLEGWERKKKNWKKFYTKTILQYQ